MVRPSSIPSSAFRDGENFRYFRFLFHYFSLECEPSEAAQTKVRCDCLVRHRGHKCFSLCIAEAEELKTVGVVDGDTSSSSLAVALLHFRMGHVQYIGNVEGP